MVTENRSSVQIQSKRAACLVDAIKNRGHGQESGVPLIVHVPRLRGAEFKVCLRYLSQSLGGTFSWEKPCPGGCSFQKSKAQV